MVDNDSFESIDTSRRSDSLKTSDTEDESASDIDDGQAETALGIEERGVSGTLNSYSPSMNTRWTISGSELYSIKPVQQIKAFISDHTCKRNDNYNVEFKCVSATVIGDLFASKYRNSGRITHPKDIVSEMMEHHVIHLLYNKAYRSKEHSLNQVFGGPWESFRRLPSYFYVLEQTNPGTVTKIKTDSQNWFKYGFMAIGDCIEGFNYVIRPVICIDATYLKARTMGVLLVTKYDAISLYYRATNAYRIKDFDRLMTELKETYPKVDDKWKVTTVDLDERSCSCREWNLDHLPCSHAIAVARFKGVSINSLVSDLYTTRFLKHAYEMSVNPVPSRILGHS
ncbi:hypothetical protein Ddye_016787 [Dipteronia dyeriana]|uniref:SWIM-type domain-containing protein n=1 Tax=Dipteronia dyeriana TaxID=168575 RepID=A0AAD9U845_9ROSI|nr:hypothetical protein Ddye_016787 [Dipteronia dyeriana]